MKINGCSSKKRIFRILRGIWRRSCNLGCYLFGSIDRAFGKDALLDVLRRPERIRDCYNRAIAGVGPAL